VLDNIGTQQYFGINSYDTADEISKRIGDQTVAITSVNSTTGDSYSTGASPESKGGNRSSSRSITHSEIARRLLKPEEILTLPDDVVLLFHKNLPVTVARLVKYYSAPEFRRGGTGAPRRLGLGGAILASCILFTSCVLTAVGLGTTGQPGARRGGTRSEMGIGFSTPAVLVPPAIPSPTSSAGAKSGSRPAIAAKPARPYPRRHRPGPSGFLIKIE
jgi:Type IV secretory system Conjugative DNA transfer